MFISFDVYPSICECWESSCWPTNQCLIGTGVKHNTHVFEEQSACEDDLQTPTQNAWLTLILQHSKHIAYVVATPFITSAHYHESSVWWHNCGMFKANLMFKYNVILLQTTNECLESVLQATILKIMIQDCVEIKVNKRWVGTKPAWLAMVLSSLCAGTTSRVKLLLKSHTGNTWTFSHNVIKHAT